jgi:hypothetical protein
VPRGGLSYDHRAAEPLLAALAPGGPLHRLTARDDLDIQLRPRSADVYAGATKVAQVRADGALHVRGDRDLDAAVAAARPSPLHTWLARGDHPGFAVVDRDVKIAAPKPALAAARIPADAAVAALRAEGVRWAVPPFSDRIDALAIETGGRVLVIAARNGADARRTGWAPAQLAMHLALARRWAEQDTVLAADVLEGQRDERLRLGLLPPSARGCVVTRPLELVPALVLKGAVSDATARRMARVADAVAEAGGDLSGLEIFRVD